MAIKIKAPKEPFLKDIFRETIVSFSKNTALHGFNYISNEQLSIWERIFFGSFFSATFLVVVILLSNVFSKWESTPVIVAINPEQTSIDTLPFPAITVCNMNQIRLSRVRNFSNDSIEMSMLETICDKKKTGKSNNSTKWTKREFRNFLQSNSQPCSQMILSCKLNGYENCSALFQQTLTDEGLCCVFNAVHASFVHRGKSAGNITKKIENDTGVPVRWTPEYGYEKNLPKNFYPRKGAGSGISRGLTLILDVEADDYYCSSTKSIGFKVALHSPIDIAYIKESGLSVKPGTETALRVIPDKWESSYDIRNIGREYRQCVFTSEIPLSYFQTYTLRNCELECEALLAAKWCKCVDYYMPSVVSNITTICGVKEHECLKVALDPKRTQLCREMCIPNCFDLSYNPSAFSVPMFAGGQKYYPNDPMIENISVSYVRDNVAVVHFYFKESLVRSYLRTRFVGIPEVLSSAGGFFGLLGFSFVSLAEIICFFGMRPIGLLALFIWKLFRYPRIRRDLSIGKKMTKRRSLSGVYPFVH